ncbi:MAG: hypothetical protein PHO32_05135, partial [Candidatus Cloacimonetes bacterium]|nr:hypothetical protein [Candidatus Cloacimonadota bacterium]
MFLKWISDDCYQKIAIVGICKNAGKTTILNHIMQHCITNWGIMTTGRDGEAEDVLFKTPKPQVKITRGSVFCADSVCLDAYGSRVNILEKTVWQSGGKPLWIARANCDLEGEIAGPQNTAAQADLAERLIYWGADKVLIDGSLDRKSIAFSSSIQAIILSIGASFGSLTAIEEELHRLQVLNQLPAIKPLTPQAIKQLHEAKGIMLEQDNLWTEAGFSSLISNEKRLISLIKDTPFSSIYFPGAITSNIYKHLGSSLQPYKLYFRHPECLKLPVNELKAFVGQHHPQCLIPYNIKAV